MGVVWACGDLVIAPSLLADICLRLAASLSSISLSLSMYARQHTAPTHTQPRPCKDGFLAPTNAHTLYPAQHTHRHMPTAPQPLTHSLNKLFAPPHAQQTCTA